MIRSVPESLSYPILSLSSLVPLALIYVFAICDNQSLLFTQTVSSSIFDETNEIKLFNELLQHGHLCLQAGDLIVTWILIGRRNLDLMTISEFDYVSFFSSSVRRMKISDCAVFCHFFRRCRRRITREARNHGYLFRTEFWMFEEVKFNRRWVSRSICHTYERSCRSCGSYQKTVASLQVYVSLTSVLLRVKSQIRSKSFAFFIEVTSLESRAMIHTPSKLSSKRYVSSSFGRHRSYEELWSDCEHWTFVSDSDVVRGLFSREKLRR